MFSIDFPFSLALALRSTEQPSQMNRVNIWMLLGALLLPCARADLCNVLDFGAKADGRTLDTTSINLAIHTHRCTTVMLPPGEYLSGTIRLKSNMVLELQHGLRLPALELKWPSFDGVFRRSAARGARRELRTCGASQPASKCLRELCLGLSNGLGTEGLLHRLRYRDGTAEILSAMLALQRD